MIKKYLLISVLGLFFVPISTQNVLAGSTAVGDGCDHSRPDDCVTGYSCQKEPIPGSSAFICQPRIGVSRNCETADPDPCVTGYSCQKEPIPGSSAFICQPSSQPAQPNPFASVFGTIKAPAPLAGFFAKDPTGAGAISQFLSNGVVLIYIVAAITLVFMLLWGAFDWMVSGGDKEKLTAAQRKIINAIIGILLFAAAFAIISVLGTFTGFTFFKGP